MGNLKSAVKTESSFSKKTISEKNMGRIYLEHLGGSKLFVCTECDTFISNNNECFSKNARGPKGSSYCFKKVVNVTYSEKTEKNYQHFTKNVYCKVCSTKLGVFYEFVPNETIRYLEGKIILEKSAIKQEESKKKQETLPENSTEDCTENSTDNSTENNSTENRTEQQHRESEVKNSDSESDSEGDSQSDSESDSENDSEKDSESEEEGVDEVC